MAKMKKRGPTGEATNSNPASRASAPKPNNSQASCAQAPVKTDQRVNETQSQAQHSRNKKRKPTMARGGKNKYIVPANDRPVATLELPDGYVAPTQAKPKTQHKRRNNAKKTTVPGEQSTLASNPYARLLPWSLGAKYPKPIRTRCTFNYDRVWRSLEDPQKEMWKFFKRQKLRKLPFPEPQMTNEEAQKLHAAYWKAGESALLKARLALLNGRISPKIFNVFHMVSSDDPTMVNGKVPFIAGLLSVAELRNMIINLLKPSIPDITALASTCKRVALLMKNDFDLWDFRSGEFPVDSFLDSTDNEGRVIQEGRLRLNTLVISPVSGDAEEKPYTVDFQNMLKLCVSITTIPSSFSSIVIDQIPFFNADMFELMVNSMPNLQNVNITRCVLLDFTRLSPLLRIIQRHPRPQGSPGPKFIRLDFYPFFFHGPSPAKRLGSYGVTWHEPTFDIPRAVFALIMRCWPIAQNVGMDLLGKSSAFWRFVSRLPGPDVLWALKAREAFLTYQHELNLHRDDPEKLMGVEKRFSHDLTAALNGDNFPHPEVLPNMERYHTDPDRFSGAYWHKWDQCNVCKVEYPRSLFPIRLDGCWGCKMLHYVADMEDSHLRFWQIAAVSQLFENLGTGTNLGRVLSDETRLLKAMFYAQCADWVREFYLGPPSTYSPPIPPTCDGVRTALSRWKAHSNQFTESFDYREGGPQHAHPCKLALDIGLWSDVEFGPETRENFERRWTWTVNTDNMFFRDRIHNMEKMKKHWALNLDLVPAGIRAATGGLPRPQDLNEQQLLECARRDPEMVKKLRNDERLLQNVSDKHSHRMYQHHVEDCLVSLTTPNGMIHSLDRPVPDPDLDPTGYEAALLKHEWSAPNYNSARKGTW